MMNLLIFFIALFEVLIGTVDEKFKINPGLKRIFGNGSSKLDDAAVIASRRNTYTTYLAERKNDLVTLINECLRSEDKKTMILRESGNVKNFLVFLDVCMIHFVESALWKFKCYSNTISETFTESDEAMAMLIFENHLEDFKRMAETGEKVSRKFASPKYTKSTNESTKFHGWHISGVKRFNDLTKFVKQQRQLEKSKTMEDEVKGYYEDFCNRRNGEYFVDVEASEGTNESMGVDDVYEEAIDGWAAV